MLSISHRWGLGLVLGASAAAASAAEGDWLTIEGDYLIGASVVSGNGHVGDAPVRYDFKPMWAFQLGPFRVSRSRASSLLKAGREELETGVSADFGIFDNWRLGASLRMEPVKWGYAPLWAQGKRPPAINARVETAATSKYFRDIWQTGRAIVPADGWYEWKKDAADPKIKQPYYITLASGEPIALIPTDQITTADVNEGSPDLVAAQLATWVR